LPLLAVLAVNPLGPRALARDGIESPVVARAETTDDRVDLYGDPLPPGAIARIGTVRDFIGEGSSEVAISPDGKWMVATSEFWDVTLRLRDVETGRIVRPLTALADEKGRVCSVAFSPDGKRIAASDLHGRVRVGLVESGERLYELAVPEAPARFVQFAADGTILTAQDGAGSVLSWSIGMGRSVRLRDIISGPWTENDRVWFAPDGKTCAFPDWDHPNYAVILFDVVSRRTLHQLRGHREPVYSLAFSPDGRRLATVGFDGTLRYWDVDSGRLIHLFPTFRAPDGMLIEGLDNVVAFSPDGRFLAAGDAHEELCIWDLRTGHIHRRFPGSSFEGGFAFSPDGKLLISGGAHFRVWDVKRGRERRAFTHNEALLSVAYAPDGKSLVTGDVRSVVRLWDTNQGQELQSFHHDRIVRWGFISYPYVRRVEFSPDGTLLSAAGDGGLARVWGSATGRDILQLPRQLGSVSALAFSPDGKTLVLGGEEGIVRFFDVTTGQEVRQFSISAGPNDAKVHGLAFSPNGKLIAVGGRREAQLWDAAQDIRLHTLRTPGLFPELAFSPDGRTLVTGDFSSTLVLWDTGTGQQLREIPVPEPDTEELVITVRSVAYSRDGKMVAAAGDEGVVRFWDAVTGLEVGQFKGHLQRISSITFSSDGQKLASSSWDGTVLLWDVSRVRP
jgi:WD40 repeat protein